MICRLGLAPDGDRPMTLDLTFASHYIKEHAQAVDLPAASTRLSAAPAPAILLLQHIKEHAPARKPGGSVSTWRLPTFGRRQVLTAPSTTQYLWWS
ncbi:MAG: hypothetical protein U5K69_15640 [Balneolaceae bacterium]|nr:hypothetical protein [Balneolaceae bacterium]